jgi:hypothetical protein
MKIKIENHEDKTARVFDYPGTVTQFIKIHFGAWGFYKVSKTAPDHFEIIDAFTGEHLHTVTKAKKADALTT